MHYVPQITVFLASPGDVNEERTIALEVFDMLEYDPIFKDSTAGGVSIHAIAWDKLSGSTPMRVTMSPQTAIKEGLRRPSQCDIVVVLMWGRMGTPLPYPEYQKDDGSTYRSGTEWEFYDAFNAERASGKPITLLYRRTENPTVNIMDHESMAQYQAVIDFFEQFRDPNSGALIGGVNEYSNPENFRLKLITHLRSIIKDVLSDVLSYEVIRVSEKTSSSYLSHQLVEAPALWNGSPFPGLRAFRELDSPIYYGREEETSDLVRYIANYRFTAVIGASGSGKSSLISAGLIPRLRGGAIITTETNSRDWRYVYMTPGNDVSPLAALFDGLQTAFPDNHISPYMLAKEKKQFIESVSTDPNALSIICDGLLREVQASPWSEVLLFVDQFEELFSLVAEVSRIAFVALLVGIQASRSIRCVITMRSDYYAYCLELPDLAKLFKGTTYPLAAPNLGQLHEMIIRPALRAGLVWDVGLPNRILTDAGTEPQCWLALMAYALDELYKVSKSDDDRRLTSEAYDYIGGVAGAISKRAEAVFDQLKLPNKDRLIQHVFRELVTVDERGTATRQRVPLERFDDDELLLIRAFSDADARLLVIADSTVEVAHEAVFRNWTRLNAWIEGAQEDLILLRQVRAAAEEWARKGKPDFLRWPAERLKLVCEMTRRQEPPLDEIEKNFLEPEQVRLLREVELLETSHQRRLMIGERLSIVGDTRQGVSVRDGGLPDIVWCAVPEGVITLEDVAETFIVESLYMAKYPITYIQFQAFLDASNGYYNDEWWTELSVPYEHRANPARQRFRFNSFPRDNISWYEAVAFCAWLSSQLGNVVRLPFEWEWQQAALTGNRVDIFPWGNTWNEFYANTYESGNFGTTAVGMYPQNISGTDVADLSGNTWEWCLNEYSIPSRRTISGQQPRSLRGGSWKHSWTFAHYFTSVQRPRHAQRYNWLSNL